MNSDHYFYIGKTHQVCEDYATSGTVGDETFGIVCDGCSSSKHTDFGARLLARAAQSFIHRLREDIFPELVINKAATQAKALDLPQECLDSTLLVTACNDRTFFARMIGDGCVIVKEKSGRFIVYTADYPGNAPYYLNYLTSKSRNEAFSEGWNEYVGSYKYSPGFIVDGDNVTPMDSLRIACDPQGEWLELEIEKDDVEFIAIMSDGVESFEGKIATESSITTQKVECLDVIKELIAFKGVKGQFVKRRAANALKKFSKDNCVHNDDVSIAVVYNDESNS